MNEMSMLAVETLFLVAAVGVGLLIMLVFRNPLRPAVLRTEATAVMISIALVVMFGAAFVAEVHGLSVVHVDPIASLAIATALMVGTTVAAWRLFGLGERLRRADAGKSPF